jgi:hypothetical protein
MMTYNEWCEYAQFGQTCEYDNEILQFVEQYNNAKHQQFLNQIDDDRANRSVQRTHNFWEERGSVSTTYGNGSDSPAEFYTRPHHQEIYSPVLRW